MSKKAKSKPAAKSTPKPKNEKLAVTTVAAPEAKPASTARRFTKAEGTVEQNGIRQPGEGTLCRKVWDALDSLRAEGKDATFDAVRELAGSEMADATIRTQRQRHREFNGIKREAKKPARKTAAAKQAAPAVASEEVQQPSV